ncbi:hypothetical protein K505DRAFT_295786 [Melanomma pulvis-pyrius CBS 109.77]|uniref:Zn(2)-C6 fungal-type domain-containing protein n=1 Tax=Melanomma pulvis-pyrius CBS 109.77 TaxID=1314802 RepID=A0A6A6XQW9_9PLEO|nr:hypothetical protein K505DRAFT_295786 [Melanomma pulvis-pyrius CBS 109.77]
MSPHTANTSAKTTQRKRAWKPKTNTGCITCRIRRVKCDELKPNCDRCTSTGRKCDGYTRSSSSQSASLASTQIGALAKHSSLPMRTPGYPLESAEEAESLHFFQKYAVLDLCGFFNSSFWKCDILRAAQMQPAIRYGITALGAMHRRYISGDSSNLPDDTSDKRLRFALQQSNRAIQEIMKESAKRSKADLIAVMTCCILFNSLACLQGHQQDALNHLRSGIKLLKEMDDDKENSSDVPDTRPISLDSIRTILITMDTQARSIMSEPDILGWEPQPKRSDYIANRIASTTTFSSSVDAQLYIEATFNDLLTFLQDIIVRPLHEMGDVEGTSRRLQHQSIAGKKMLDELLFRSAPRIDIESDQTFIALRLIQALINILSASLEKTSLKPDGISEKLPSQYINEKDLVDEERNSATIMALATKLMQHPDLVGKPQSETQSTRRPVFTSNFGVIIALWLVATRAPDYDVRRKAITMMLSHPRREGLWDGPLAGKIALEAMKMEEEGTREGLGLLPTDSQFAITHASQVPVLLWMRNIGITYTGVRKATVEYRNVGNIVRNERGCVKYLAW